MKKKSESSQEDYLDINLQQLLKMEKKVIRQALDEFSLESVEHSDSLHKQYSWGGRNYIITLKNLYDGNHRIFEDLSITNLLMHHSKGNDQEVHKVLKQFMDEYKSEVGELHSINRYLGITPVDAPTLEDLNLEQDTMLLNEPFNNMAVSQNNGINPLHAASPVPTLGSSIFSGFPTTSYYVGSSSLPAASQAPMYGSGTFLPGFPASYTPAGANPFPTASQAPTPGSTFSGFPASDYTRGQDTAKFNNIECQKIIGRLKEQDPSLENVELSGLNEDEAAELLSLAQNSNIKTLKITESNYRGTWTLPPLLEKLELDVLQSHNTTKLLCHAISQCSSLREITISQHSIARLITDFSAAIKECKSLESMVFFPINSDAKLTELTSALKEIPSFKKLELRANNFHHPALTREKRIDELKELNTLEVLVLDYLTMSGATKLAELLIQNEFLPALTHIELRDAACKYDGALALMRAWLYRSDLTMAIITETGLKRQFINVLKSEEYQTDIKNYLSGILPNRMPVPTDNVLDKIYSIYQIFKGNYDWYYKELPNLPGGNATINLALLINRFNQSNFHEAFGDSLEKGLIKMISDFMPPDEKGLAYIHFNQEETHLAGEDASLNSVEDPVG